MRNLRSVYPAWLLLQLLSVTVSFDITQVSEGGEEPPPLPQRPDTLKHSKSTI